MDAVPPPARLKLSSRKWRKSELIFTAHLAEITQRFGELTSIVQEVTAIEELTLDERNFIVVAYKNAIAARRASWHVICSIENRGRESSRIREATFACNYGRKLSDEVAQLCYEVLQLLQDNETCETAEEAVFYHKVRGDCYRYLAELERHYAHIDNAERHSKRLATKRFDVGHCLAQHSLTAYQQAIQEAKPLPSTVPLVLGANLNLAVLHFQILGDPNKAIEVVQNALKAALDHIQRTELNKISKIPDFSSGRDSISPLLHTMQSNLRKWVVESQRTPSLDAYCINNTKE